MQCWWHWSWQWVVSHKASLGFWQQFQMANKNDVCAASLWWCVQMPCYMYLVIACFSDTIFLGFGMQCHKPYAWLWSKEILSQKHGYSQIHGYSQNMARAQDMAKAKNMARAKTMARNKPNHFFVFCSLFWFLFQNFIDLQIWQFWMICVSLLPFLNSGDLARVVNVSSTIT